MVTARRYQSGDAGAGKQLSGIPRLRAVLPLLRHRIEVWTDLLIVASATAAVETIQSVFALGASGIDDVSLNTLGLIGIL